MTAPATVRLEMLQTVVGYGYAGQIIDNAPNNDVTQGLIARGAALINTDPPRYNPLYPPAYVNEAMLETLTGLTTAIGDDPSYLSETALHAAFLAAPSNPGDSGQVLTKQADGSTAWAVGTGTAGTTARTTTLTVAGDSVARASGDTDPIWTQRIATALGRTFRQTAYSGQASEAIFRLGALDLTTAAAFTIPAGTTPVAVTFSTLGAWAPVAYDGSSGKPGFPCSPGGIPGTLFHDVNANASTNTKPGWTFQRTTAGSPVTVPSGTVVHCTDSDANRGDDLLLVLGTNYPGIVPGDTTGAIFLRDIDLLRRYWLGPITLMGIHMRPGDPSVQPTKQLVNAADKLRFGDRFIDLMGAVLTYGMTYTGTTPTSDDQTKLANGQVPVSLMSVTSDPVNGDTTHPGPALYRLMEALTLQAMNAKGDKIGAVPQVTTLPAGAAPSTANATTSSVDVTPATVTGAAGYLVQYRLLGASVWISGSNTTGPAVTVGGLANGSSYEFRTVPASVLGYGAPSATVTAATSGTAPTVLMSDSFSGADTASINNRTPDIAQGGTARTWTTNNAFLGIASGVLTEPDVSGRQTTGLFDPLVTDGRLAVTVKALPSAGLTITLYVRCTAVASGYYAVVISDTGLVRLNKHDGTTPTTLGTQPAGTAVVGDRWEVRAVGTAISAIRNGATVLTATDSTVTTGTKAGVNLQRAAAVDDLVLWDK